MPAAATRESVRVDLPWSTWAMTDMFCGWRGEREREKEGAREERELREEGDRRACWPARARPAPSLNPGRKARPPCGSGRPTPSPTLLQGGRHRAGPGAGRGGAAGNGRGDKRCREPSFGMGAPPASLYPHYLPSKQRTRMLDCLSIRARIWSMVNCGRGGGWERARGKVSARRQSRRGEGDRVGRGAFFHEQEWARAAPWRHLPPSASERAATARGRRGAGAGAGQAGKAKKNGRRRSAGGLWRLA